MRRFLVVLLCLSLFALPALAETSSDLIFTGKVQAKDSVTLYAPFGGILEDYALQTGDRVEAGEALFQLKTAKIFAPCDGVVSGIFAQVGDSASFVLSRYGALCFVEQEESLVINTTTAQGHDSAANRFLHVGETVYLRSTSNSNRTGEGRIIAVSGQGYSVEILSGDLWVNDSVNIHREEDFVSTSRIGRGMVSRVNPIAISGDGAVIAIAVEDGQEVRRGDLLFEMVSGGIDGMEKVTPVVTAPEAGIVASIQGTAGQSVAKNQALAKLYTLDRLQLVSSLDEVDIPLVQVGDRVSIEFDSIPGKRYEGVITGVSGIGTVSDNYTEYAVYIEFVPDEDVRLGMSATAYPIR